MAEPLIPFRSVDIDERNRNAVVRENNLELRKVRNNIAESKERQRKNRKRFNVAANSLGFLNNNLNNFAIPFFGMGELSISGVIYAIVICMVVVFMFNRIYFFGSTDTPITFTSFLTTISSWNITVDFANYYSWVSTFPTWLGFLQPLFNLIGLVIEMVVGLLSFIFNLINLIFGLNIV